MLCCDVICTVLFPARRMSFGRILRPSGETMSWSGSFSHTHIQVNYWQTSFRWAGATFGRCLGWKEPWCKSTMILVVLSFSKKKLSRFPRIALEAKSARTRWLEARVARTDPKLRGCTDPKLRGFGSPCGTTLTQHARHHFLSFNTLIKTFLDCEL